jgi:hypothetical protein
MDDLAFLCRDLACDFTGRLAVEYYGCFVALPHAENITTQ